MQIEPTSLAASSGLIGAGSGAPTITDAGVIEAPATTASKFGLSQDSFFKLFLAELQNQDPTQPLDNKAMVDQLGTFSMIDTLMSVQKTMQGVQLGQAAGMIGKLVAARAADGSSVVGIVSELIQQAGSITLLVNGVQVKPEDVSEVSLPPEPAPPEPAPPAAGGGTTA